MEKTSEAGFPATTKTTPTIQRVPKEELEGAYFREPTAFNIINKTTEIIMSAGYRLSGAAKSVSFFGDFFNSVGSIGGEVEWEEMLNSLFRHEMIFGEAWLELVPGKGDNESIVDLEPIDPKKMDYVKDSNYKILLDKSSNVIGYVQKLPFDYIAEQKYSLPKDAAILNNQVFLPTDKVAHFKLYTVGDEFYPIGLIEPSYDAIIRKLNTEQAHANAIKRIGFPTRRGILGDPTFLPHPTEEQLQRFAEQLKNMDDKGVLVHPHYANVVIDEAKAPQKLQEHLVYYENQIITASGLPEAFATGKGGATNRATLLRQESLAKLTMKDIVRRTTRIIEKRIINKIAQQNGISPVKIIWGEIAVEELDDKAKRLVAYRQSGLITPDNNLERLIRDIENLPEREIREEQQ